MNVTWKSTLFDTIIRSGLSELPQSIRHWPNQTDRSGYCSFLLESTSRDHALPVALRLFIGDWYHVELLSDAGNRTVSILLGHPQTVLLA
jgi:hypothetical protein